MIIYKITNKINGKIYIGQTIRPVDVRWRCHCQKGNALFNAINKYGKENFTIEEIDRACSINELNEKEIFWIKELNCVAPNGYNLRLGGESGGRHSEETRKRISEASKGRVVSEDTRKKKSIMFSGENNPAFGKNYNQGKECSPETRDKISKAHTGMKRSEETCRKIGESKKGIVCWRNGKKFGHENGRKNQYEFDVFKKESGEYIGTWNNQRICAEELGMNYKNIQSVLSGRRPSASGYVFKKKCSS